MGNTRYHYNVIVTLIWAQMLGSLHTLAMADTPPFLFAPAITFSPVSDQGGAEFSGYPFKVDNLSATDLNHDGLTDLAVIIQGPDMVHLLMGKNQPNGLAEVRTFDGSASDARLELIQQTFGLPTYQMSRPRTYRSSAETDFERNGSVGLAIADFSMQQLLYLEYDPAVKVFRLLSIYPTLSNPDGMAIGDFNQDGLPDIVLADYGNDDFSDVQNNGRGTFESRNVTGYGFDVGPYPDGITVADFNGDQEDDVAIANSGGNSVSVNRGSVFVQPFGPKLAGFSQLATVSVGSAPSSIASGDFNGDRKPDIAVTDLGSNAVSVLLNLGGGSSWTVRNYPVGVAPAAMVAADLNGDGNLDLAIANRDSNTVSVLLGKGDGTFLPKSDYPVGSQPSVIVTGDFNGDGKPDLATANFGDNTITLLYHSPIVPGDLNQDDKVTAADVTKLLRIFLGIDTPTPNELAAGDVRPKPGSGGRPFGDGKIRSDDVNWVLRRSLGLEVAP